MGVFFDAMAGAADFHHELLLTQEEINRVFLLRNFLGDMPADESIVFLLKQLMRSKNNKEFFVQMAQGG